ncbi:hypothetical protein CDD83_10808 [Cordyceps sp. RAO-2017]|nr:hypothetical protein CDD83_10808 [Cordyceps sp. RAO-2017]
MGPYLQRTYNVHAHREVSSDFINAGPFDFSGPGIVPVGLPSNVFLPSLSFPVIGECIQILAPCSDHRRLRLKTSREKNTTSLDRKCPFQPGPQLGRTTERHDPCTRPRVRDRRLDEPPDGQRSDGGHPGDGSCGEGDEASHRLGPETTGNVLSLLTRRPIVHNLARRIHTGLTLEFVDVDHVAGKGVLQPVVEIVFEYRGLWDLIHHLGGGTRGTAFFRRREIRRDVLTYILRLV